MVPKEKPTTHTSHQAECDARYISWKRAAVTLSGMLVLCFGIAFGFSDRKHEIKTALKDLSRVDSCLYIQVQQNTNDIVYIKKALRDSDSALIIAKQTQYITLQTLELLKSTKKGK